MNATALKIIAVICMTLDHLATYLGAPLFLRYPGRFAAVIFFFCIAESAVKTHDRKQFLLRLYKMSLLMAGLSIILPFALRTWFPKMHVTALRNNIFTAMVPCVWLIDILEERKSDPSKGNRRLRNYLIYQAAVVPAAILILVLCQWFPEQLLQASAGSMLMSEGGIWVTIQIILFYFCRGSKKKLAAGYLTYCAVYTAVWLPQLPARVFWFVNAHFPNTHDLINNLLGIFGLSVMEGVVPLSESLLRIHFQCFMVLVLPLLLLYNGERGKGFKRFFYIYYPAHICLLYLIKSFVLTK